MFIMKESHNNNDHYKGYNLSNVCWWWRRIHWLIDQSKDTRVVDTTRNSIQDLSFLSSIYLFSINITLDSHFHSASVTLRAAKQLVYSDLP